MQSHGLRPLRLTAATTDGNCIFAVRYASDDKAPTLYIGPSSPDGEGEPSGPAVMVLSEPLDSDASDWREVEMSQFVTACNVHSTEPIRPVLSPRGLIMRYDNSLCNKRGRKIEEERTEAVIVLTI